MSESTPQQAKMDHPLYDFPRIVTNARLVQMACCVLEMFVLHINDAELGYFYLLPLAVAGFCLAHLFKRWHQTIDGRYDLKMIFHSNNNTVRLQYAMASLTAVVLAFVNRCVLRVVLSSLVYHNIYSALTFTQLAGAVLVVVLEAFEVFVKDAV